METVYRTSQMKHLTRSKKSRSKNLLKKRNGAATGRGAALEAASVRRGQDGENLELLIQNLPVGAVYSFFSLASSHCLCASAIPHQKQICPDVVWTLIACIARVGICHGGD